MHVSHKELVFRTHIKISIKRQPNIKVSKYENTQSRIERNKIQMTFHKRDYTNNIYIYRKIKIHMGNQETAS